MDQDDEVGGSGAHEASGKDKGGKFVDKALRKRKREPMPTAEELSVPEGCSFTAKELEVAIRVGRELSEQKDAFEAAELRELRRAWGPVIARKAKMIYQKEPKNADGRAARIARQRAHDRKLIETRRLREARRMQLEALQGNDGSTLAAIPDGAVDDGVNTSHGQAGGTEAVPQVLSSASVAEEETEALHKPRSCYSCKARFFELHHFYDQFCPDCAEENWTKRLQKADMNGKVVLLTGGRVKIGYHTGLKCLRMGATLHVTSRFVADAALRYSKEADFAEWKDRLHVHGVDFRDIGAVERFARHLSETLPRLDAIINNACQTIRRPPLYYKHLMDMETKLLAGSAETGGTHFDDARKTIDPQLWHQTGAGAQGATGPKAALGEGAATAPTTLGLPDPTLGAVTKSARGPAAVASKPVHLSAAQMSQVVLGELDEESQREDLFPRQLDVNGSQLDLRSKTSWTLKLDEVQTPEVVEVLAVNTVAPTILNARLKALMEKTRDADAKGGLPDAGRYIVNVSAMEGKFYRHKAPDHPHTNMAKAALNMMTRTSGGQYAAAGIYMTAVDTGWVNDEQPLAKAAATAKRNNFQTPIDEVDAAARVLDPVVSGMNGGERLHSVFLKDYRATEW